MEILDKGSKNVSMLLGRGLMLYISFLINSPSILLLHSHLLHYLFHRHSLLQLIFSIFFISSDPIQLCALGIKPGFWHFFTLF